VRVLKIEESEAYHRIDRYVRYIVQIKYMGIEEYVRGKRKENLLIMYDKYSI
jgi:hypothetical protein